ncbi:MAG TPA: hypothetical protein VGH27_20375 [Streptosporangiaceae bacterium]
MSWADPGGREPERDILERSPGWWSRALSRAERLLRLDQPDQPDQPGQPDQPDQPGRPGGPGRLGWLRRRPRWVTALGVLVLAGAAAGVVVSQQPHTPAARPPVSSAPDTGILEQPLRVPPGQGLQQITGVKLGSKSSLTIQSGTGNPPASCAAIGSTVPAALGPGYRTVLGDVVVPPAYLYMLPNGDGAWSYWQEATFLVRGASPAVTVSVPPAYQGKAAVDLETNGIGSTFHVTSCPDPSDWVIETGGFYLKEPAACIPLRVQSGTKSTTVWFGLGERCPAAKG